MDLLTPGLGLIVWTVIIFSILLFMLRKFAWNPINNAVKTREESIRSALNAADKAREDIKKLQDENERILKEARIEKEEIMKEARSVKEKIIAEAKEKADSEGKKMIENARISIQNEKDEAISDIKLQITNLSIEISEIILRKELKNENEGKALVEKLLKDIKIN
ncbi:MAG: F0F1 ATP synthase subunit B [Bacteroidales bacterium]|nr:F0F1 ATP synthase subunit B [Bacteroidales bacterium]